VLERDVAAGVNAGAPDYVPFLAAGETAAGQFRCAECGYGVAVSATLPRCPMCSGVSWERTGWRGVDADRH
jgi:rubrerythrin